VVVARDVGAWLARSGEVGGERVVGGECLSLLNT
jgi:hypothetical protein